MQMLTILSLHCASACLSHLPRSTSHHHMQTLFMKLQAFAVHTGALERQLLDVLQPPRAPAPAAAEPTQQGNAAASAAGQEQPQQPAQQGNAAPAAAQHSKQHLDLQAQAHSSSNSSCHCSSKGQQPQRQHNLLLLLSQQPGRQALLSLQGAWRRY